MLDNDPFIGATIQELMEWLMIKLPNATLGEDNEGQLIIYTDLQVSSGKSSIPAGDLQPFDPEEYFSLG